MRKRKMNSVEVFSMIFGLVQIISSWIIVVPVGMLFLTYKSYTNLFLILILGEITFIAGLILLIPFIQFILENHKLRQKTK